jgi:Peptidase family M28
MSTQATIQTQKSEHAAGTIYRSFLAWVLIAVVAAVAIFSLRAPTASTDNAPAAEFSAQRALVHVRAIAVAPHPIGSPENERVRNYLVAQLSGLGFNPQVFRALGMRSTKGGIAIGDTESVVGRLPGTANSGAIMLVAHYDSVSRVPGAADDATGVAAILEAARALRAGSSLKNDLILLFTDGEEVGLLGAHAFADFHPWMKDVGLIMNFEARGSKGPALLFETGPNNAALLQSVARSASHPVGSSLFYALYKLLPNDTDFTVFRRQNIRGLNFAFGENLEAYHSRFDTVDNLSSSSLQHHGSYALDLTRAFGDMNLPELQKQKGDGVFFDWLGAHFITYRQSWVLPGQILVSLGLVVLIFVSMRRAEIRKGKLLPGLLCATVCLIAVPAIMAAAYWLVSLGFARRMIAADSMANSFLMAGFVLLGACVGTWLLAAWRKYVTVYELSIAGLILTCLLNWVVTFLLPAGSYLLFWPWLITIAGLIVAMLLKTKYAAARSVTGIVGVLATILLFAPIIYLLYIFLTLQLLTVLGVGLLIGVAYSLCAQFLDIAVPPKASRVAVVMLLFCALTSILAGISLSGPSLSHPRRDSIIYSVNADDHTAALISYDAWLDGWTAKVFGNKAPSRKPAPDYLGGLSRPVFWSSTAALDMAPPVAEIKADQQDSGSRKVLLKVKPGRKSSVISIVFAAGTHPVSLSIGGRTIDFVRDGLSSVKLFGMKADSIELEFTLSGSSKASFWLMEQAAGLPDLVGPRPNGFMAAAHSDETLVCRKYDL